MVTKIQRYGGIALGAVSSVLAWPVSAQITHIREDNCKSLGLASCPGTVQGLWDSVYFILNGFLALIAVIALIILVYGGVVYILARGEEDEARRAKNVILYALIGMLVIGFSAAILNFVIFAFQSA